MGDFAPLSLGGWHVVEGGQARTQRIQGRLGAAGQVQLAQDIAHMGPHSPFGNEELGGDLLVAEPLGDEAQDFKLALGERIGGRLFLAGVRKLLQHFARDVGLEGGFAAVNSVDRLHELLRA